MLCGGTEDTYLPRTLVPGFDPSGDFEPIDSEYIAELIGCPSSCQNCFDDCPDCRQVCRGRRVGCLNECDEIRDNCKNACPQPSGTDPACEAVCDYAESFCENNPLPGQEDASYIDPGCRQEYVQCEDKCVPCDCDDRRSYCEGNCADMEDRCTLNCAGDSACEDDCDSYESTCNDECANVYDSCSASGCESASGPSECESRCRCVPTGQLCGDDLGYFNPVNLNTPTPEILAEIEIAKGSCGSDPEHELDHTRPDDQQSFINLIDRSIPEAENQVAKFKHRRDFLQRMFDQAQYIRRFLLAAKAAFDEFLDGPAADLIQARIDYEEQETGLPYHAVYGWKDEPKDPQDPAKWHIVKVEARIPGSCDNECGPGQGDPDPEWPKIKTYTKSWGTKRCYELTNVTGYVKFRTIRYDEERISDPVKFPNNLPIWKFRGAHPKRMQGSDYKPGGKFDPAQLDELCATSQINTFLDDSPTDGLYEGAFMMEKYIGFTAGPEDNSACWNLAHELLARGVIDETCAQYFWDDASDRMNFRFVSCKEF